MPLHFATQKILREVLYSDEGWDVVWPTQGQPAEPGWYIVNGSHFYDRSAPNLVEITYSSNPQNPRLLLGFGPLVTRAAKLMIP